MNIKTKIVLFTLSSIITLCLIPAKWGQAETIDYKLLSKNNSKSSDSLLNPGTPESKPSALNVVSIIPTNKPKNTSKTENSDPNITSTIGWKNENGDWYYYKSDNTKAIGWIKPNSKWYYLKDDGKLASGWIHDNNGWYYIDSSGAMVTGWRMVSNKWYYFADSGIMATGIQFDGSNLYYFTDSGTMSTDIGWMKINNKWYYADKSGIIDTGWLNDGGNWYFLQGDGSMVNGVWCNIDNNTYMFKDNGVMANGWINMNNHWYYLNSSGEMKTGWISINSTKYYLYDTGAMATGWLNLSGTWFYLNSDGSMVTGWVMSNADGSYYYLDTTTGKLLTNTNIDGYKIGADGKRSSAVTAVKTSTETTDNSSSNSKTSSETRKNINNYVTKAAKKYGVDSKLILAIIQEESGFNPKSTSSSGAEGLMQIMPDNFTHLGISNGYDIEQNINGGTKLLKEYLSEFNGDVEIALAAYNAGPQNVKEDGVSTDSDLTKMSQGVQDYVEDVMAYYKNGVNSYSV